MVKKGKKIVVLGAGNVGATIAYTLAVDGMASELVLIDINHAKAMGEAMDIRQGTPYCPPVNIYAGDYQDSADADIVIVTIGIARKPGQSRIDLAQANLDIISNTIPKVIKYAPNAVYVVVSNPVDILTYVIATKMGINPKKVIGTGTLLDTSRLRSILAENVKLSPENLHAFVLGEHGDTSVVPWSLVNFAGTEISKAYKALSIDQKTTDELDFAKIEQDVRKAGGTVIGYKGATYYAIALTVRKLCETILRDTNAIMTVSGVVDNEYGLKDVALSIPFIVGVNGIKGSLPPVLSKKEEEQLKDSAKALKTVLDSLEYHI